MRRATPWRSQMIRAQCVSLQAYISDIPVEFEARQLKISSQMH